MAFSVHSTATIRPDKANLGTVSNAIYRFAARSTAMAKSVLKAIHAARTKSVLANMSDQQLAAIGITRSEILQYAERLIAQETDGKNQDQCGGPQSEDCLRT
ncbi:protein of unknown function [Ruegeria faecimaris]|uniref:DUF1127 domain-containing protein n=1 Tax=Ruegeria faecimaris TaxID=686389 RepID=A0A521ENB9_9RHOB|nr:protein of unknown function [Ruegeria faecimaris]